MKKVLIFLTIVAPIIALLAFGLTRDPHELPSAMIGKKAPDFILQTLNGKIVTLQSMAGSPVLINFWATWCGPCLQEHPALSVAEKKFSKLGIKILGVVYQDSKENVSQYLKETGDPTTPLFDPQSKMAIDYGVGGVPETFFVDRKGIIREKFSGVLTLDYIESALADLLENR